MNPPDITGTWVSENAVAMGGGTMRIASVWNIAQDGSATLSTSSVLEHDGREINRNAADYAGRWTVEQDKLVVDLQGHPDSPFRLGLTEAGELKSRRQGTWRPP